MILLIPPQNKTQAFDFKGAHLLANRCLFLQSICAQAVDLNREIDTLQRITGFDAIESNHVLQTLYEVADALGSFDTVTQRRDQGHAHASRAGIITINVA